MTVSTPNRKKTSEKKQDIIITMSTLEEIEFQGKPLIQQYENLEADQSKINQSVAGLRSQVSIDGCIRCRFC